MSGLKVKNATFAIGKVLEGTESPNQMQAPINIDVESHGPSWNGRHCQERKAVNKGPSDSFCECLAGLEEQDRGL